MTTSKMRGEWRANRQTVKNTLDANAFEILGGLLSGNVTNEFSQAIRLLDDSDVEIATQNATFVSTSDATSVEVSGSTVFPEEAVTSEVHKLQLISSQGRVMATATLGSPLPADEGVKITRVDTITAE